MLSHLDSIKPLRCDHLRRQVAGGKAFVANERFSEERSHREYPFRLKGHKIECTYYEIWRPTDSKQSTWSMIQAYFTMFLIEKSRKEPKEILCIHCEPADNFKDSVYLYKRCPHLHLVKSEQPLPHCHFPLCFPNFDYALSSIGNLTTTFKEIIKMLQYEVVQKYDVRK